MNCIVVVTTVGTREEARRIGSTLVERRLAACAQISEVESFYTWDGALRNETEFRLELKTTDARYGAVEQAIRELHSYALPAIHAQPLAQVYPPYAAWVERGSDDVAP
ncbi:MAG TPA: divalent-cation tolerance protein CutA [Caldimonas sp.]